MIDDPMKGRVRAVLREDAKTFTQWLIRLPVRAFFGIAVLACMFVVIEIVTGPWQLVEQWADQEQRSDGMDRVILCKLAAACRKYSDARDQCATAGSLKACVRIKMGEDAFFADHCSGYDIGASAVPLPAQTPSRMACFFLLWPKPYH